MAHFSGFNCMRLGRHMSPMMLHALHQACVPLQELRTKQIFHMAFGIILKYYSQGLKPLGSTLSLSFPPSSPQSLTHSVEA
jgi:hypothetical protein